MSGSQLILVLASTAFLMSAAVFIVLAFVPPAAYIHYLRRQAVAEGI